MSALFEISWLKYKKRDMYSMYFHKVTDIKGSCHILIIFIEYGYGYGLLGIEAKHLRRQLKLNYLTQETNILPEQAHKRLIFFRNWPKP